MDSESVIMLSAVVIIAGMIIGFIWVGSYIVARRKRKAKEADEKIAEAIKQYREGRQ